MIYKSWKRLGSGTNQKISREENMKESKLFFFPRPAAGYLTWGLPVILSAALCGCSAIQGNPAAEDKELPYFKAETQVAETLPTPSGLPEELCPYEEWTRETEWTKIASAEASLNSPSLSIYANREDQSGLYLLWGETFLRAGWEKARSMEAELEAAVQDFDRDGKEEAAVILRPEGGAHWAREELHILDEDEEGRILDTSFPLDAFEDWILENPDIEEWMMTKLDTQKAVQPELSDPLYLIYADIEEERIVMEAVLEAADIAAGESWGVIRTVLEYDGAGFQVSEYEIVPE